MKYTKRTPKQKKKKKTKNKKKKEKKKRKKNTRKTQLLASNPTGTHTPSIEINRAF